MRSLNVVPVHGDLGEGCVVVLADHEELDVEGPTLEVENAEENARSVARHELETALGVFELDAADLLNDEVGDEAKEAAVPFALDFDPLAKLVAGAGHECEVVLLDFLELELGGRVLLAQLLGSQPGQ